MVQRLVIMHTGAIRASEQCSSQNR